MGESPVVSDRSSRELGGASSYQHLVVRTQSPYQPATTQSYPTSAATGANNYPTNPYPTPAALPSTTDRYTAGAYGGQAIGATGPDAVATGSNPYAVRQAAITEPQLPPTYNNPTPVFAAPQPASPTFGPPR